MGDGKTWKCLKESYSSLVVIWMRIIIKILSALIIQKIHSKLINMKLVKLLIE